MELVEGMEALSMTKMLDAEVWDVALVGAMTSV